MHLLHRVKLIILFKFNAPDLTETTLADHILTFKALLADLLIDIVLHMPTHHFILIF